jgi:peptidoglycan/LPS O-acetylase OafA/YrhL
LTPPDEPKRIAATPRGLLILFSRRRGRDQPAAPVAPSASGAALGQDRVWFAHAIRGPACLIVVSVHLGHLFWTEQSTAAAIGHFPAVAVGDPAPWPGLYSTLTGAQINIGSMALCLFFLVSGFVVPYALERGTLGSFFVRRFFRLYPTLWACLLLNLGALALQARLLGDAFPFGPKDVAGNAFLLSPYLRMPWIEPVLWSLAVEELFYVLAALAAWRNLLARRSVVLGLAVGLTAASLAGAHVELGGVLFWLAFNSTFVVLVLLGVVFHQIHRGRWGKADGAAILLAVLACFEVSLYWGATEGVANAYGVAGAAALGVFAALYWARDRLPEWRVLEWLGDITYPLYMVHALNGYIILRVVWLATGSYYLAIAAAFSAALAMAAVVHHFVDRPTNDFGRRLAKRMRTRAAAARPLPSPLDTVVTAPTPVGPAG